jgi:hypothetical protein
MAFIIATGAKFGGHVALRQIAQESLFEFLGTTPFVAQRPSPETPVHFLNAPEAPALTLR